MALTHISKDPPNQTTIPFTSATSFINKAQKKMMWIPGQDKQPGSSFYRDKKKIPGLWSYAVTLE